MKVGSVTVTVTFAAGLTEMCDAFKFVVVGAMVHVTALLCGTCAVPHYHWPGHVVHLHQVAGGSLRKPLYVQVFNLKFLAVVNALCQCMWISCVSPQSSPSYQFRVKLVVCQRSHPPPPLSPLTHTRHLPWGESYRCGPSGCPVRGVPCPP